MQCIDVDLDPDMWHPLTLLYMVDGLSEDANHTVILTTTHTSEKRPVFFDYAVVRSTHT